METYQPTDVVLTFGIWFNAYEADTDCGETLFAENRCPHMPTVCDFFDADRGYNVYWQTTTPSRVTDDKTKLVSPVSEGHNLNAVTRCGLSDEQVIDRDATFTALQPNESRRASMYYDKNHLHTQPNHAFNLELAAHLSQVN